MNMFALVGAIMARFILPVPSFPDPWQPFAHVVQLR